MRPLARHLSLISYKAYALPTYSFDKSYISVLNLLHIFSFLESSRFVKFVPICDRFLDVLPFKSYDFGNKSLFVVIEERRFVYL
jgi:hypothetical protein